MDRPRARTALTGRVHRSAPRAVSPARDEPGGSPEEIRIGGPPFRDHAPTLLGVATGGGEVARRPRTGNVHRTRRRRGSSAAARQGAAHVRPRPASGPPVGEG